MVFKKKEMVRNVLRDSDIVKFYCIHGIPLYGSVMHILCWYYDYLLFIAYIWIDKIYDSDDLRTTGVNTEDDCVEFE